MNVVWCSKAMEHFGRIVSNALGWRLFIDAPVLDADTVYIIGMYDPPNYGYSLDMTKGAKRRVIHWCGSDVYGLVRPDMLPDAIHLCESPWLQELLRAKGVASTACTFPTGIIPEVTPLPPERMVGVYIGSSPMRYGEGVVRALADMMPDTTFHVYGFGQYTPDEMLEVIDRTRVYLRLCYPDGSATSAREYMCAGRRAITTVPVEYAVVVNPTDLVAIKREIDRAMREEEPHYDAAAYHQAFNTAERFAAEFRECVA